MLWPPAEQKRNCCMNGKGGKVGAGPHKTLQPGQVRTMGVIHKKPVVPFS
uniref:Uncharacterized protein n=1 Tax=Anguilla anguilla TaxID=7936 RepID=A0A0E9VWT2_ANGAN